MPENAGDLGPIGWTTAISGRDDGRDGSSRKQPGQKRATEPKRTAENEGSELEDDANEAVNRTHEIDSFA